MVVNTSVLPRPSFKSLAHIITEATKAIMKATFAKRPSKLNTLNAFTMLGFLSLLTKL